MVLRKVQFYEVRDDHGERLTSAFDGRGALHTVSHLDVQRQEAHFETRDAQILFGKPIQFARNEIPFLAVYRIRHEDLPSLEQMGEIRDLELDADSGLAEGTHLCFFPNSVVGLLYNHFGPRPSRIAEYLNARAGVDPNVTFHPILRPDIMRKLEQFSEITILDLAIPVSELEMVRQRDQSLARALDAAHGFATSRRINLRLQLDPRRDRGVTRRVRTFIGEFIRDGRIGVFRRLKVKGLNDFTEEREWLDVLGERITVEAEVETRTGQTRTISDDSARAAIGDGHAASLDEISEALGVADD